MRKIGTIKFSSDKGHRSDKKQKGGAIARVERLGYLSRGRSSIPQVPFPKLTIYKEGSPFFKLQI